MHTRSDINARCRGKVLIKLLLFVRDLALSQTVSWCSVRRSGNQLVVKSPLAAEQQRVPIPPAAFPGPLSAQWGRMRPTVADTDGEGPGCAEDGLPAVSISLAKGWGEAELPPAWPPRDCGLCDRRRQGEDGSGVRESRLLLVTPSSTLQLASKTRAVWSRHR